MNIARIANNILMEHPVKTCVIGGITIGSAAIYGAYALAMALQRGPIHEIKNSPISEQIDKFVKSEHNNPDVTGLDCYKVDTFQIEPEMFTNYEKLANYLQRRAKAHVPDDGNDNLPQAVAVGIATNNIALGVAARRRAEPLYSISSIKAIAQDKVFTNEDGDEFYIPVECYGKKIGKE